MNLIITLAVLFSGGLHGFTFAVILIKVFGLHKQNLLIPERITNFEEKASLLMGNTIVITFIVVSNVAWTDYFANPLRSCLKRVFSSEIDYFEHDSVPKIYKIWWELCHFP